MSAELYTKFMKKWTDQGVMTPGVFKQEDYTPSLRATVAPYLPLVRYSEKDRDYVVISQGKPIAFDSYGYIVPAGLALEIAAEVASPGSSTIAYTATDVAAGVVGPDGTAVSAGEKVAALLVAAGVTVSLPFALAFTSYYRANSDTFVTMANKEIGGGGVLPHKFRYHNYNPQGKVSVITHKIVEVPVVATYDPVFGGVVVFDSNDSNALPTMGAKVKIDANSNFVLWDPTDNDDAAAPWTKLGTVVDIDLRWPKGYLQYVKTVYGTDTGGGGEMGVLDQSPGSATSGLPSIITYAGGTADLGTVHIMFDLR